MGQEGGDGDDGFVEEGLRELGGVGLGSDGAGAQFHVLAGEVVGVQYHGWWHVVVG